MRSIVHDMEGISENECFLCGRNRNAGLEKHHIFGGPNRKLADKDGLYVMLCSECHRTGRHSVHNDRTTMDMLHYMGRRAYLEYHTEKEFLERYGRNYGQHNPSDRES